MKFATKAIHAGQEPDASTGAIMTPIFQTSTYVQAAPGTHKGYEYSRTHNPTRRALENNLAALEEGKYGLSFASGMAAEDAIIKLLKPGDEVISSNDIYGGSFRMFTKIFEPLGIKFHFTGMDNPENILPLLNRNTKMLWLETPSNPMLNIIDIKAVSDLAKRNNVTIAVDNTFASPYLQNPLVLGADIVIHSVTKYLGGHSDLVMGAVVCKDDALAERLYFIQNSCGAIPSPHDCFLALRGIKTLHIRMQRHCENAREVVRFLDSHPAVDRIYWPGLPEHINHNIARTQMKDFGGMASFTLKDDTITNAHRILSKFRVFSLAESLGGVESLCGHPASMTHASIPKEIREKSGIKDSLIRLSVGIEDIDDLLSDLNQALS